MLFSQTVIAVTSKYWKWIIYNNCCTSSSSSMKIALCQLSSTNDKVKNYEVCKGLIKLAQKQNALMVFLPECFDYIATNKDELFGMAEPLNGPLITKYKELAKELKIWLSLGGFHHKIHNSGKIKNTHIIIDDAGGIVGTYDKIHMFDLNIPPKIRLIESETTLAGTILNGPVDTPLGKMGLQICYDIRFPYPSNVLRFERGADVLTYPSAFTIPTGKLHWEILNRCRAIENQCYVISAAQVGKHNDKRSSYGHSMVCDPMGKVLIDMGDETQANNSYSIVEIASSKDDLLNRLADARSRIPMEQNMLLNQKMSSNLFPGGINESKLMPIDAIDEYPFGSNKIPSSCVFARNETCYAFINRAPLLPGHVLVSTIRINTPTLMNDCTAQESSDLFLLARHIGRNALIPTYFSENQNEEPAFNITIQDGTAAGRTVPQIHIHIIPRHFGDMPSNDDNEIYRRLASHDKEQADPTIFDDSIVETTGGHSVFPKKKWRTVEDMMKEASIYRNLLYK